MVMAVGSAEQESLDLAGIPLGHRSRAFPLIELRRFVSSAALPRYIGPIEAR